MGESSKAAWAGRLIGALVLSTAMVPFLGVSPAMAAESTTVLAGSQGYFNAAGVDKPEQFPATFPNPINSVDGVEKDHLAVAAKGGKEDKVSALMFDPGLASGSLITKALLTLTKAENSVGNQQLSAAAAKVRSCAAGDTGFGGEDGSAIALAPERLCKVFSAPGKDSPDMKAYVFDITGLAATWVDGANDGLTLTAAEGADSTNFQVVFLPSFKGATLAIEFTAPLDEVVDTFEPVDTPDTSSSDLGGSFSGEVLPPPTDSGTFGSVSTPTLPEPAPGPTAAAPQAAAPETSQAAGPVRLESLRPTTAFWLGGLLLVAVLALLSLVLGDSTVRSSNAAPSRLSRALADRRSGTSLGRPALGRPIAL